MRTGNLIYASDKAVKDALIQHKFTKSDLKEIFLSRGILVSNETEREELALYFSRLNHDYYDHKLLSSVLGVSSRREKTSITNVNNVITSDAVEKIMHKIKEDQSNEGDEASVKLTNNGAEIKLKYTQIDYNKSEFKQVVEKEAIISIEIKKDGLAIRYPLNDYIGNVKNSLLDEVSKEIEEDEVLVVDELELRDIVSAKDRTSFFTALIKHMPNYILYDVSDVYVYHPKEFQEEDDLGVHISKATLKGEGVLESSELKSLYKKGFYIWKIRWTAKGGSYDSDLYEFEAQFSDAENCSKFSYLICGFYKYKSDKVFVSSKKAVPSIEEVRLGKLIEDAAQLSRKELELKKEKEMPDEDK